MADWDRVFEISKKALKVFSIILIAIVIFVSPLGVSFLEWAISMGRNNGGLTNFIRDFMRVDGTIGWVDFGFTIFSLISTMIARSKKRR
jgi:hypothetical protein